MKWIKKFLNKNEVNTDKKDKQGESVDENLNSVDVNVYGSYTCEVIKTQDFNLSITNHGYYKIKIKYNVVAKIVGKDISCREFNFKDFIVMDIDEIYEDYYDDAGKPYEHYSNYDPRSREYAYECLYEFMKERKEFLMQKISHDIKNKIERYYKEQESERLKKLIEKEVPISINFNFTMKNPENKSLY